MNSDDEVVVKRQTVKIKPRMKPRRVVTQPLPSRELPVRELPAISPVTPHESTVPPTENQEPQQELNEGFSRKRRKSQEDSESRFFVKQSGFMRKAFHGTKEDTTSGLFDSDESDDTAVKEDNPVAAVKIPPKPRKPGKRRHNWMNSEQDSTAKKTSFSLSDDDKIENEGDDLVIVEESNGRKRKQAEVLKEKEDSLTPPPEMQPCDIKRTMSEMHSSLIRSGITLDLAPTNEFIMTDPMPDLDLDPELLSIAQNMMLSPTHLEDSDRPSPAAGSKVLIMVQGKRHPEMEVNEENRRMVEAFEKPLKFMVKNNDNFEQLAAFFCKRKLIPPESLVLTYKNVKVFLKATPASLGMVGKEDISSGHGVDGYVMEAHTKEGYRCLKEKQEREAQRRLAEIQAADGLMHNDVGHSAEAIEPEEHLHLKLRGKDKKDGDEKVRVKKTTTVQAIINQYRKAKQLPVNADIRISFEDETLDPLARIGDTDVEDGDMLDVRVVIPA